MHTRAKFFGQADHDNDMWTQNEKFMEDAVKFFGDGSNVKAIYENSGEKLEEATAKFHGSDGFFQGSMASKNQIPLSYDEARRMAYDRP